MLVKIDDDMAIDMLVERVRYWTQDEDIISLYEKMYENYVYGGIFEGGEFDVMKIVDNDYVNWTRVIYNDEEDFEEILKIYKEQGFGDCSCETEIADFIESVDDEENPKMFLVR